MPKAVMKIPLPKFRSAEKRNKALLVSGGFNRADPFRGIGSCETWVFHKFTTYKFIYQRLYGKILTKVFQRRTVLSREDEE
jgi:hypothetical protein